jgi:hypothetical protein
MDQLTDQMGDAKIRDVESIVDDMKKNNMHWAIWTGDNAPILLQHEKCGHADEVILELYWKNGKASDIHEIRCRCIYNIWWKRTSHNYIKVNNVIVGEVLCLFSD